MSIPGTVVRARYHQRGCSFLSSLKYRGQLYSIVYGQATPPTIGQKTAALTYPNSEQCGVDICHEVIDIANSFMQVYEADVEAFDWPWEKESFDYVIMGDILEHLRYPDIVLKKVNELLKPGGIIVVSMPNVMHYSVMVPLLTESKFHYASEGILDTTHLKMYTKNEIEKLINNAGFSIEAGQYTMFKDPSEEEKKVIDVLTGLMKKSDPEQFLAYQYIYKARKIG